MDNQNPSNTNQASSQPAGHAVENPVANPSATSAVNSLPFVKKYLALVITVVLIVVVAASASAFYWFNLSGKNNGATSGDESKVSNDDGESDASERLQRLDEDLNLDGDDEIKSIYYTAGKVPSGTYKGYTRVIEVRHSPTYALLYATKDFQTYIEDYSSEVFEWTLDDNSKAVFKLDRIDSYHPLIINVDDNFALVRGPIFVDYSGKLTLEFSNYQEIKGVEADVKLYDFNNLYDNQFREKDAGNYLVSDRYIMGVDSTGLIYKYSLTRKSFADEYWSKIKARVEVAQKDTYNSYDAYILPMVLSKSDIFGSSVPLYTSYVDPFPKRCPFRRLDLWKLWNLNLPDDELSPIGRAGNIDVYTLKDNNHPLYKLQYESKVGYLFGGSIEDVYKMKDPGSTSFPSFEAYVAKNPLLFFKDSWGRWIVLGEEEIGEKCGRVL